jgi:hypothetical protein
MISSVTVTSRATWRLETADRLGVVGVAKTDAMPPDGAWGVAGCDLAVDGSLGYLPFRPRTHLYGAPAAPDTDARHRAVHDPDEGRP